MLVTLIGTVICLFAFLTAYVLTGAVIDAVAYCRRK
jgi:hypothetical protein